MEKKPACNLLWRRTVAFLIDLLAVYIMLLWPFLDLIKKSLPTTGFSDTVTFLSQHPQTVFSLNVISLFATFLIIAYFAVLEFVTGSTIGMLALSLRVIPLNHELRWWQCITRHLFLIPILPFPLLILTEAGTLLWSKGNTRLLETLSKTRTIHEPQSWRFSLWKGAKANPSKSITG